MTPLATALADSARVVARVAAGHSLRAELAEEHATPRSALLDLTHGTLRRYGRVQAIVSALAQRSRPAAPVEALLWCALYALESGRYGAHTVVNQAVSACVRLGSQGAKGFVNALLRGYLRQRESLDARLAADPEARWQHPRWWIELVRGAYPQEWAKVLEEGGNAPPPMCLRVNLRRGSGERYARRLAAAGIEARVLDEAALLLLRPLPVALLPGFLEGEVSVQDHGAQRAAHLLDLAPRQRVLDACAAPGGKSAHILERADVSLCALDIDAARCRLIERNLERLGLQAAVRAADCGDVAQWWDGQPFDRILADVPCSSSGVARRHPDIKWLRRAADVAAFAARQAAMLDALWRTLAPGGKLLYATCSVFPQENDAVVAAFLARTSGARRLALADGAPAQSLPAAAHDGFYYAFLEKRP